MSSSPLKTPSQPIALTATPMDEAPGDCVATRVLAASSHFGDELSCALQNLLQNSNCKSQQLTSSKRRRRGEKTEQSQSHQWETSVTGNDEIANSGHRQARAQEAQHVRSSTMTTIRGEGKEDKRLRTPSPTTKRQPTPKPKVSNQTGTSQSSSYSRPPCLSDKKSSC